MKFGDKVTIRDGSRIDGCEGIIYRLEEARAFVLLDKEVLWPVALHHLEAAGKECS